MLGTHARGEAGLREHMRGTLLFLVAVLVGIGVGNTIVSSQANPRAGLEQIKNVVVIYAENRSFDNLYGFFPGANGLQHLRRIAYVQRDRDGSILKELPPIWGGLTAKGVTPPITEAQTGHLANAPFALDDGKGFNAP